MFTTRLLLSVLELVLMIFVSGLIVFVIYRVFVKSNPDFDMEEEIRNGNEAEGPDRRFQPFLQQECP